MIKEKTTIKDSPVDRLIGIIIGVLLFIMVALIVYPLIYTVSASFSEPMYVLQGRLFFLPVGFTLEGYELVFRNMDIMIGYRNSLIITFGGTVMQMVVTFLAAYPLSRRDLWGRNFIMKMFVFTMYFSGGIIPLFIIVRNLGIMNTWWALTLPVMVSTFNLIIMRTFFERSIPYELQEAAFIDGCSDFGILCKIVLPLSGPIIAVISLFYAVAHWNSFFNALLYINDRSLMPLQIFLREILVMQGAQALLDSPTVDMARQMMLAETIRYSVIVVSSVPMLLLYPFIQRFFVKGVMIGALKG